MARDPNAPDMSMNAADLYREETYTDRHVGTLRVLTPVKSDGSPDPSRKTSFLGQAQLLTPVGALPLSFEVEADSLAQAVEGFAAAAEQAVEQALKELQEMRREAASSLIIPESGAGGGMPGAPGGGRIQLR